MFLYGLVTILVFIAFLLFLIGITNSISSSQKVKDQGKSIVKWSGICLVIHMATSVMVAQKLDPYMEYRYSSEETLVSTKLNESQIEKIKKEVITCEAREISGNYHIPYIGSLFSEAYVAVSSLNIVNKGKVELSYCEKQHESDNKKQ